MNSCNLTQREDVKLQLNCYAKDIYWQGCPQNEDRGPKEEYSLKLVRANSLEMNKVFVLEKRSYEITKQ